MTKSGLLFENAMEATPVVWNDQLFYVVFFRKPQKKIEIRSAENTKVKHERLWDYDLGSAFVVSNRLYVIGTSRNALWITFTSDLENWSPPALVLQKDADSDGVFNSSVTKVNDNYVLAYEVSPKNSGRFFVKFKKSKDLGHWEDITDSKFTGEQFNSIAYAAAPTIKYLDGTYYLFYLSIDRDILHTVLDMKRHYIFSTKLATSKDLINWSNRGTLLSPLDHFLERSNNNSDFDLTEFNGHVEAVYSEGNQLSEPYGWSDIYRATSNMPLNEFLNSL